MDDSQEQGPPRKAYGTGAEINISSLVANVLSASKPPPYPLLELGMPVILSQRRSGSRSRGFVRAYAPTLDNYGIYQQTFLRFVTNFDDAMQTSPVLGIVRLVGRTI